MQLGRWEDAISAFSRALEIEPTHAQARGKRTEARQRIGDNTPGTPDTNQGSADEYYEDDGGDTDDNTGKE